MGGDRRLKRERSFDHHLHRQTAVWAIPELPSSLNQFRSFSPLTDWIGLAVMRCGGKREAKGSSFHALFVTYESKGFDDCFPLCRVYNE